jgi:hypothetical protein
MVVDRVIPVNIHPCHQSGDFVLVELAVVELWSAMPSTSRVAWHVW